MTKDSNFAKIVQARLSAEIAGCLFLGRNAETVLILAQGTSAKILDPAGHFLHRSIVGSTVHDRRTPPTGPVVVWTRLVQSLVQKLHGSHGGACIPIAHYSIQLIRGGGVAMAVQYSSQIQEIGLRLDLRESRL